MRKVPARLLLVLLVAISLSPPAVAQPADPFQGAAKNGEVTERVFGKVRKMLRAWLSKADPKTMLLPDAVPDCGRTNDPRIGVYTPHNSGADNYPYLVAASFFTEQALYRGRMREMLRNEIRYTNVSGAVPGNLNFKDGTLGPMSIFGAAEYAKDGLLAITELLGRTPWFYRMVDMTISTMEQAPVQTRFGKLPDAGAEINGDMLQVMVRLSTMTSDQRFQRWAEVINDAYVEEILPNNHGLPSYSYDFVNRKGPDRLRLRDHGNEIVVGLVLFHALESYRGTERARRQRPVLAKMLDRILESANPDGMLYDEIRCSDLAALNTRLSDNWGYIYGAVYSFYMVTGEQKYRDAVVKVLKNLPRYRNHNWENGGHDGYADSIESALYLVNREPVPEALDWIESETARLLDYQRPDGLIECWYGDGNWARTLLLYCLAKTQGCFTDNWQEGVRLGADRSGDRLYVALDSPPGWRGRLQFDHARHSRVLNFDRNYVRLNEWPEWFTVDENRLYSVTDSSDGAVTTWLGSDLKDGIPVSGSKRLIVERRKQE